MASERVARLISNVLNPVTFGAVCIVVVTRQATASFSEMLHLMLTLSAINVIPIIAMTVFLLRSGRIDSVFIRNREQRTTLYLFAAVLLLLSCALLRMSGAPRTVLAFETAMTLVTFVYMFVNFRWKISMHAAFVGVTVATLCQLYGLLALFSLVMLPAVGWSRIKLGYHTLPQVVTGMLGVVFILCGVFTIFGLLHV